MNTVESTDLLRELCAGQPLAILATHAGSLPYTSLLAEGAILFAKLSSRCHGTAATAEDVETDHFCTARRSPVYE